MKQQSNKYRVSTEQKVVEGILKAIWWLITLPFRLIWALFSSGKNKIQKAQNIVVEKEHQAQTWAQIEQLMQLGNSSNYAKAILEADKLLDHLLKEKRVPGLTMGDRLKASRNLFSREGYNAAWQAHKIRNELVHNSGFEATDFIAKPAIENYHLAIKDLSGEINA